MSECCIQTGVRSHSSYWYGATSGTQKDADILFPHREVAVVGALPDWQWLEENNLMTQEYEGISIGQRRVDKYRYSRGAKIFLFLLTISTAIALYGLYHILTY
ncbi:hypothetical protein SBON0708_000433 [Salmonella bongori serovar 48:i:- str. 94-0708]|uniref:Uncharacterized protein n=1 Tax=Salmonella enterica TaxID=28901 RepID=A0A750P2W6_SALER|nr:hypothetical protein [Salmonella bongori serovar 48:i:- str. 94-0708]